jgi:glycosyltransferase involved in cell wall biosynthesis
VVIPTYNRPELTIRAINSVATKRPHLVEIIVVDDCGEIPFIQPLATNIHGVGVTALRTSHNSGPAVAREFGVRACNAEAVAFLDSDDVYEEGWIDAGLNELIYHSEMPRGLFIVGKVRHGASFTGLCFSCLSMLPRGRRLSATRLIVLLFNPFYTPSVILTRDVCEFSAGLRFCEDYYTNAIAAFRADKLVVSHLIACSLSRKPGSTGGESEKRREMFRGEFSVRLALLRSPDVPRAYKLVVPLGMAYQLVRTSGKWLVRALRSTARLLRRTVGAPSWTKKRLDISRGETARKQ